MFLISLAIAPTSAARSPELRPDRIARSVRQAATAADGLEHVSVRTGAVAVHLGMFCLAPAREIASRAAHDLCRRALAERPDLEGWRLVDLDGPSAP
ncbi:hypothetical protein [Dactylosporangium salmoneum]|uniref:BON domain-containing protein n=1 Tax=Dactylosporangium salmoneum TaxID=53361 RepID=A0ABP5V0D2_9ACTN